MANGVPVFIQKVLAEGDLTQAALSRHIRVSQGQISKWLNGVHLPNLAQWERLLAYARRNAKTRHLVESAPELSLDAMLEPYDQGAKAVARSLIEAYLKSLPKP